jgi:hypothetical protein
MHTRHPAAKACLLRSARSDQEGQVSAILTVAELLGPLRLRDVILEGNLNRPTLTGVCAGGDGRAGGRRWVLSKRNLWRPGMGQTGPDRAKSSGHRDQLQQGAGALATVIVSPAPSLYVRRSVAESLDDP